MEALLKQLRMVSLPVTVKVAVVSLLLLAAAINLTVFVIGMRALRGDLVGPTLQFFASVLPLLLIALALARTDTGVAILRKRTGLFVLRVAPVVLSRLSEHEAPFYSATEQAAVAVAPTTQVWTNFVSQECCTEYLIATPDGEGMWKGLVIRLELNVRRLNFNLYVPKAHVTDISLVEAFRHTLGGAAAGSSDEGQGGYAFLPSPIERRVQGTDFLCLVGSKIRRSGLPVGYGGSALRLAGSRLHDPRLPAGSAALLHQHTGRTSSPA